MQRPARQRERHLSAFLSEFKATDTETPLCSREDGRARLRKIKKKTEGNLASAATARPGLDWETPVCQSGAMATLPIPQSG